MLTETFAPSPVDANNGAQNHPALTPVHWWDYCDRQPYNTERAKALAPIAAAFYQGGALAVIKAASGSSSIYLSRAWALAMTAVHGPVGTHPSQTEHPEVIRVKAKALAELRTHLGV